MKKRFLCVLLAALILMGAIPMMAVHTEAVSTMTTSEECIEILKDMEGFIKMPMWDHSQYSIGYGSRCDPKDYPNGITEEQADKLLREFLMEMEEDVNKFAAKYQIIFAQNQFDALMLFTYNCGTGWTTTEGEFRSAVIEGKTGNEFLAAITLWSSASSQLHLGLVNRRLIEADMYLNDSYENRCPSSYTYVMLDNNGGESEARAQGYDCNLPAAPYTAPTREGYRFLGWYTAAEGGSWITELGPLTAEQTLVAHWQEGSGDPEKGIAADYSLSSDQLASLEFRNVPGGVVKGTLNTDAMVDIVADYVDANGVKWGKLMNGCWVNLGSPLTGAEKQDDETNAITVTVTGDVVNVRSGPGTTFKIVAQAIMGDKLAITEIRQVGTETWGKFRAGWIRLDFTSYDPDDDTPETTPEEDDEETPEGIPGTVNCKSGLNIRGGPGTNYGTVGCYAPGDKVYILEQRTVDGVNWGRTDRGWISLQYVKLEVTEEKPEETPEEETQEPTVPEEEPTVPEEETEDPADNWWDESHEGQPATVVSNGDLNIRSGAGLNYPRVGSYSSRSQIYILEQKAVDGVTWGRTDKGWVCMQYVLLHYDQEESEATKGTVVSNSPLNIRSAPGTFNAKVGTYIPGTRITIYEQTTVNGQKWGRTSKGWVCMIYVALDSQLPPAPETPPQEPEDNPEQDPEEKPEEKPDQDTGAAAATGTVTASALNIRAAAGTNSAVVGSYPKGTKVTILEQKLVNGVYWGRTDKGWISLQYVKMDSDSASVPGGFTGTVTASNLNIRKGPGTGYAGVGSYKKGDKVTILETTKVGATTWGRTDMGWICMDYVK